MNPTPNAKRIADLERLVAGAEKRLAGQPKHAHLLESYRQQLADARRAAVQPVVPASWWQQEVGTPRQPRPPRQPGQGPSLFWQIVLGILAGLVIGAALQTRTGKYVARSVVRGVIYRGVRAMC